MLSYFETLHITVEFAFKKKKEISISIYQMSKSKVHEVKLLKSTLDYRLYVFIMFTDLRIRKLDFIIVI